MSSNLLRLLVLPLQHPPAFLREPFKIIELSSSCQAESFSLPEAAQTRCWRSFLLGKSRLAVERESPIQKHRTAQNIKQQPAKHT
jgi:hypothetical protein